VLREMRGVRFLLTPPQPAYEMKTLESIISNAETAAASATGAARYDLLNIAQMAWEELAKTSHENPVSALSEMVEQFGHYCEHTEDPAEIAALERACAVLESIPE
jgi:hypothetical protein